jgi:hypothetical protein
MRDNDHLAPWGRALKVISTAVTLFLPGISAAILLNFPAEGGGHYRFLASLPVLIVVLAALLAIRGYRIDGTDLRIRRLFWSTRVPMTGLISAEAREHAMRGSIRLAGNGGMYSFSGWWWSKGLGRFRAFVTDLQRTVILRMPERTIVVSPGDPERFAAEARTLISVP